MITLENIKEGTYLEGQDLWTPFANLHMIKNRHFGKLLNEFKKILELKLDYWYSNKTIKLYLKGYSATKRNRAYYIIRKEAVEFFKKCQID